MLTWRTKKQLKILSVIAIPILIVLGIVGYSFIPKPSCFDNKKNQGEFNVDCGGSCIPCELKNPDPISVFWARAVKTRNNFYDIAAEIKNPNNAISSPLLEYEFSLFDNIGIVGRSKGSAFIFNQERLYIVEPNVETVRIPTRVEFKVSNAGWKYEQRITPNMVVERREHYIKEDNGLKQSVVEADIVNRSSFDFRKVEVIFILLDSDGNLLGANNILMDNFTSGSRRMVKSIWPEPIQGEIAKIEIGPRVNLFDPDVIIKPQ